jgi:hypothetical protein
MISLVSQISQSFASVVSLLFSLCLLSSDAIHYYYSYPSSFHLSLDPTSNFVLLHHSNITTREIDYFVAHLQTNNISHTSVEEVGYHNDVARDKLNTFFESNPLVQGVVFSSNSLNQPTVEILRSVSRNPHVRFLKLEKMNHHLAQQVIDAYHHSTHNNITHLVLDEVGYRGVSAFQIAELIRIFGSHLKTIETNAYSSLILKHIQGITTLKSLNLGPISEPINMHQLVNLSCFDDLEELNFTYTESLRSYQSLELFFSRLIQTRSLRKLAFQSDSLDMHLIDQFDTVVAPRLTELVYFQWAHPYQDTLDLFEQKKISYLTNLISIPTLKVLDLSLMNNLNQHYVNSLACNLGKDWSFYSKTLKTLKTCLLNPSLDRLFHEAYTSRLIQVLDETNEPCSLLHQ